MARFLRPVGLGLLSLASLIGSASCSLLVSTAGLDQAAAAGDSGAPLAESGSSDADGGTAADAAQDGRTADVVATTDGGSTWSGNNHVYSLVSRPAGITWAQADVEAKQAGGHLVTLGSDAENTFVVGLLGPLPTAAGQVWTGGRQPVGSSEPAGGWTWATGEPFVFTAWGTGQPNNTNGSEDTMVLDDDGTWNDSVSDRSLKGYVLEVE